MWWILGYGVGALTWFFVCYVFVNVSKEDKEPDIALAGGGAFFWPILLVFFLLAGLVYLLVTTGDWLRSFRKSAKVLHKQGRPWNNI